MTIGSITRRMSIGRRLVRVTVVSLFAASLAFTSPPTFAQDDAVEGSVTITGYRCPAGSTPEAFEPAECEATTFGFGFTITSNEGIAEPLTTDDATLDGSSYRLGLGPAARSEGRPANFGNWAITFVTGDGFSNDYVVLGDAVVDVQDGRYSFLTTTDAPDAVLSVYIFLSSAGNATDPPPATSVPGDPEPEVAPEATESAPAVDDTPVGETEPVEEGTGRFVRLVEGTCEGETADGLGDEVSDLGELTIPIADPDGAQTAIAVETTFASVELTLDELLAEDHAIVVLDRDQDDAAPLACGDIGGAADAQGAVSIGLREVDGSGYAGIAYLISSDTGVTVSLFVAEGLG